MLQSEFTNQLGLVGKKARERQKELRTLEHSPLPELPENRDDSKLRKTNNWHENHKKPSLVKNLASKDAENENLIEDEEILTVDEKNQNFLKKVPKGQESHIKHVLDRQTFIDKRNGVKKPKTF